MKQYRHTSTTFGFKAASGLLQKRIRTASESRGFAESRLLTHWPEIVGADLAAMARPVDVKYGRQGLGATLTVLTTGAMAPMLEMQKEQLRDKVNACYGYRAIAKVRITQTAATGFAEGQVEFAPKRKSVPTPPRPTDEARELTAGVESAELKEALTALAANVFAKTKR